MPRSATAGSTAARQVRQCLLADPFHAAAIDQQMVREESCAGARAYRIGAGAGRGIERDRAAKKDGRWEAAYAPEHGQVPDDLRLALSKARGRRPSSRPSTAESLPILYRIHDAKKPETRAAGSRIRCHARCGETLYPWQPRPEAGRKKGRLSPPDGSGYKKSLISLSFCRFGAKKARHVRDPRTPGGLSSDQHGRLAAFNLLKTRT